MTQPTFRSSVGSAASSGGTTITASEPAGAASDDIELASLHYDGSGTPTPPANWTLVGSATLTDSKVFLYWLRRTGSAPALGWTISATTTYIEANLLAISGCVTTGSPIDSFVIGTPATTGSVITPPPVSIVTVDTLVSIWGFNWQNGWNPAPTAPSGYTLRRGGGFFDCVAATKGTSATGTETPGSFGAALGSNPNVGATIVLASLATGGGGGSTSDDPTSAGMRQLRQNAIYRMSPRSEQEAKHYLSARKRAYGFAAQL